MNNESKKMKITVWEGWKVTHAEMSELYQVLDALIVAAKVQSAWTRRQVQEFENDIASTETYLELEKAKRTVNSIADRFELMPKSRHK